MKRDASNPEHPVYSDILDGVVSTSGMTLEKFWSIMQ